jgi:hypothetical protein
VEKQDSSRPAFAKFRPACKEHGVGATAGYELVNAGLLHTFKIGAGTYIELSEFARLPERLADPKARARLDEIKRGTRRSA